MNICFIKKLRHVLALAMSLLIVHVALAQTPTSTLTGQVLDTGGAAISNATVTVTNNGTGVARIVQSDSAGRYLVSNLNPGIYTVAVEATGFQSQLLHGVVLQVSQEATLNINMSVGQVSQTVNVTAAAAVTDTETSSEGAVIDNRKVVGLPLNSRSFYSLALLSPAADMPAQNSTLGFRGGFNVAGNEETANTFTVNGIDDNDQNVMAPSFRPSVEAIQEFKLLTGVYSAEYGRTSGGQVVVVTKSGTNQFHGDAFEFIRNQVTDAKNFFTLPGVVPAFRRNQFGGTLGGPIVKDHTFFFVSYEGMRLAQEIAALATVPTIAMRSGDFSAIPTQLHNPYNGQPLSHNQIPQNLMSTLGSAIFAEYPLPTVAQAIPSNNFGFNEARIENMDEVSARVDQTFSSKDSLVVQYNYFNDPSFEPSNSLCGAGVLPGFGCTTNQTSTLAGVNWTHIFTATLLNEFRIGYDRLVQPRTQQDVSQTNFPKLTGVFSDTSVPNNYGLPETVVSGYATLAPYTNLPQVRYDDHYQIIDNLAWTHGSHNLRVGINLLKARYTDLFVSYGRGYVQFNSSSSAGVAAPTTGYSLADLMVGVPYETIRNPSAPIIYTRYGSYGFYGQDDWKVTPYLTLNLGLRYEYFTPVGDARNYISNYDLASETMIVAGQSGIGKYVYNSDLNNWGPRIGVAWQPFRKQTTVVHSAVGIFYNSPPIGNGTGLGLAINAPQRVPQTFFTTAPTPLNIDTNPFPTATSSSVSISPTGIQRNFRTMYVGEYSLDVQQQLTPSMSLTVGYLGTRGLKLPNEINPNQAIPEAGPTGPVPVRPITGSHCISYPAAHCYTYTNISYYESEGASNYSALQVKLDKSYSHGLSMLLAYTWAKSMDDTPGYASTSQSSALLPQNSYNILGERGLSDYNVGQRFVLSPVYQLPFGKGQRYLTSGWGGRIAGGWQLSGIGTVETGRPFTVVLASNNTSGSFNNEDRPNMVAGQNPNSGPKSVAKWFNTSAFTTSIPKYTFGNEGRNTIIGPGYVDVDLALQREFPLAERISMAFRAESFDVANKPNFFNPTGSSLQSGTSSFGTITQANDPREMQFSVKVLF